MSERRLSKTSVFLSYARGDDDPFVWRLYEDLTARGFEVWFDQVKMPSRGLPFPTELREAIDTSVRFVLVVGPRVATSAWCRAEWEHADVFGRPITPLVRMDGERSDGAQIDGFELIPKELKLQELHADDLRDDERYDGNLELLVGQLLELVVPPGKLIGVPALPTNLLARNDRVQSLRDALLSDFQRPVGITGVHGMGGIGKSVFVNLLARDPRIRRAFRDGVFWVPIGIEPEILPRQVELASALGYEGSRFESLEEGCLRLSELLAPKSALLVLDDVWTREAAGAFNVLGPKCRAVITTRDGGLITSLGCTHYELELLTDAEALCVLTRAAGIDEEAAPEEARGIARCCGNLPLALALSGGLVRRGIAWDSVLRRLKQAALECIGERYPDPASPQHQSVSAALQVSIDALSDDESGRFLELSVFPLGAHVPEAAAHTLWSCTGNLDEFSCEDLLVSLRERSLLLSSMSGEIAFHNLVHAFASKLAGDPKKLHEQILDAYRIRCRGAGVNAWATGPNDGYFFQYLSRHLAAARRDEELLLLLTGSQAWMDTKFRILSGDNSLVVDLDIAIARLAEPGNTIDKLVRLYSVRQLVQQRTEVWDEDLETLVYLGRTREAFGYARLRSGGIERIRGLLSVHVALMGHERNEHAELDELEEAARSAVAHDTVELMRLDGARAEVATVLWRAGRIEKALALVDSIATSSGRLEAVQRLGDELRAGNFISMADRLVDIARGIESVHPRVRALGSLAEHLSSVGDARFSELFEDALRVVDGIRDPADQVAPHAVTELRALAGAMSRAGYPRAQEVFARTERRTMARNDAFWRSSLAVAMAAAGYRDRALELAVGMLPNDGFFAAETLADVAVEFARADDERAEATFDQAVQLAVERKHSDTEETSSDLPLVNGDQTIVKIAGALARCRRYEASGALIGHIASAERRALAQSNLATQLSSNRHFERALGIVLTIDHENSLWRLSAMRAVSRDLARAKDNGAKALFEEYRVESDRSRNRDKPFRSLSIHLSRVGRFRHATAVADMITDPRTEIEARTVLATEISRSKKSDERDLFGVCVQMARNLPDPEERVRTLCNIAVAMSVDEGHRCHRLLTEAVSVARTVEDINYRMPARLLRIAASSMTSTRHPEAEAVFEEALGVADLVRGYTDWAEELCAHAITLAGTEGARADALFGRVERRSESISHEFSRMRMRGELAASLAQAGRFTRAKKIVGSIPGGEEKDRALQHIARALAQHGSFGDAYKVALSIETKWYRSLSFGSLGREMARLGNERSEGAFVMALESAQVTPRYGMGPHARRVLACDLADAGRFCDALATLGPIGMDEFLEVLTEWRESFERLRLGNSGTVVEPAVRIAAWQSPVCRDMDAILRSNGLEPIP